MSRDDESGYAKKVRARKLAKLNASTVPYVLNTIVKPDANLNKSYVLGLDPSHWSKVLDWQRAYAAGIRFAIIKAKNGINTVQYFKENYKLAKDAGVLVNSYLWLYPASVVSPGRQGREYAALLKDYPPDFPPAIDFEWTKTWDSERRKYVDANPNASDLYSCAVPLMEAGNYTKLINYTAPGYWNQYGSRSEWFADIMILWQAQYRVLIPDRILPWDTWTFWQFTDKGNGQQYGFPRYGETNCTLNYFNGTLDELRLLGDNDVPAPPPVPEPPIVVTPPEKNKETDMWYDGKVKYEKEAGPHGADVHILTIKTSDIEDIVTDYRYTLASTMFWLGLKKDCDIAINGLDQFSFGRLAGFAAYQGKMSGSTANEETVYISKDMKFSLKRPRNVWTATSFPNCLIRDGVIQRVAYRDPQDIRARTAIGWDKDQTKLVIVIADGADYAVKKGLTFLETTKYLMKYGVHFGIMGDGGNSTTGARRIDGKVKLFNAPNGENNPVPGEVYGQRSVGQHLGIKLRKEI